MSPIGPATNAGTVGYTVTFSEPVTGVDAADFQLALTGTTAATITQVTPISNSVYTVTVSGITGDGTLGLNLVDNDSIRDLAGNPLIQQNAVAAFHAQETFATGLGPTSVALGDLTGDGKNDLVVTYFDDNTVSVLLGNGNGTFQKEQSFATGVNPSSVALGDVNGDGNPDLVVANFHSNTVSVLLGNGNGTFQAQQTFATGKGPDSVALGDVSGDGKTDLVVSNFFGNTVSVLLGNGNGTFQAQQTFATSVGPTSAALGDVNGDGKPDLVVADGGSAAVSVLIGNGNGTFQAQLTFATGAKPPAVALGDVNGDGKLDIAVPSYQNGTVNVLLANGTFQPQQSFATGVNPVAVALGDVNGDGNADLVVANYNDSTVSVLLGNGNGTFQAQQTFAVGDKPTSVALGDVNDDGRLDIVVPDYGSGTVSVLLGAGNGNFTGQVYTIIASVPTHFAIAAPPPTVVGVPFTVTVTAQDSSNNTVTGYTGTVHFTTSDTGVTSSVPANYTFTAADAGVHVFTSGVTLVTAGMQTITAMDTTAAITGSATVNVAAAPLIPPVVLSINCLTPTGPVTNASTVEYAVTFSEAVTGVAASDFGLALTGTVAAAAPQVTPINASMYLVTINGITGNGTLGLNLVDSGAICDLAGTPLGQQGGLAAFKPQQTFATGSCPSGVVLADLSGDGKPDIVVANYGSGGLGNTVSVLLGNGNGTFQAQQTYATGLGPCAVAVGDVNGDGKPDLVVVNERSYTVSVLLGNGNGTFQAQQTFAAGGGGHNGYRPNSVALGHLTGDGKLDIVTCGGSYGMLSVLLGNGNGTFQAQQTFSPGSYSQGVVLADLTGDGKDDIVYANQFNRFAPNRYGGTVSVLLGNGNGTFQARQTFATGPFPSFPAVGDVNGDGKPDLVVCNSGGGANGSGGANTVDVLLGNGNGTFQALQSFSCGPWACDVHGVVLADLTGDGKVDLAVADYSNTGVSVLLGNANGTFQAPQTFAAGGFYGHSQSIATCDVNGDGKPDLVVANWSSNEVSVLLATIDFTGQVYMIAPPFVQSIDGTTPPGLTTSATTVSYTVTFSAPVTGVDPTDFQLALTGTVAAAVSQVTPTTGSVYTVTISGITGTGTLGLNLVDNGTIRDLNGDPLKQPNASNGNFTGQVYTITTSLPTHFAIIAPINVTAGTTFLFTVVALDANNNTVTGYSGIIAFASSDGSAGLPGTSTLTGGVGTFTGSLMTPGSSTIDVVNAVTRTITGTSTATTVNPGAATHFALSAPTTATAGSAFTITVTALAQFNNTATAYTGTVHFTSSDGQAVLPANATLTGGVGVFTATLKTPGNQTLTATDTVSSSMTGSSGNIAVQGLSVTSITPNATGFVAQFNETFAPQSLQLYYGPPDVALSGPAPSQGSVRGSLMIDPSNTFFTFITTGAGAAGVLAPGTYTVTIFGGASGIKDLSGSLLATSNSAIPGANFVTTFTVAPSPSLILSIPDFARGPNSAANIKLLNNSGTGLPITLTNPGSGAVSITALTFALNYNPALLTISGTTGSIFLLAPVTAGLADFKFQSSSVLTINAGATLTLGQIVAQVPSSAASNYKAKALLHLSNIAASDGDTSLAVIGNDGLELVAYLGDVVGDGTFSPLDAALMSRVAVGFQTGFAAFPLVDPAIIGDPSGNGAVSSTDVTLMNRLLAGFVVPQVPPIPAGLTINPTGPDPTLSVPTGLTSIPGGTVIVPVNIDTARPIGSTGMMEAVLALRYNPAIFELSAADVQLGTVPATGSGWQLTTAINSQTGEIGVDLFSSNPIQTTSGGSLVTIALQVRETAPPGSTDLNIVRQVNPTGQRVYDTTVADTQGAFVLHEAAPAAGAEPGEADIWVSDLALAPVSEATGRQLGPDQPQQTVIAAPAEASANKHAALTAAFGVVANIDLAWPSLPPAEPPATLSFSSNLGELEQAIDTVFETLVQSPSNNDYTAALTMEAGVGDGVTDSLAENLGNSAAYRTISA